MRTRNRLGDNAEMAIIELIKDRKEVETEAEATVEA
jgi:hypothetical protein